MIKIDIPEELWKNYQESSFKYHRYGQILAYINDNEIKIEQSILEFYMIAYMLYLKQFETIHFKLLETYVKHFGKDYKWKVYEHEPYIIVMEDNNLC